MAAIDDEDRQLFRQTVGNNIILHQHKRTYPDGNHTLRQQKRFIRKELLQQAEAELRDDLFSDFLGQHELEYSEYMQFQSVGLPQRTFAKLKRGQMEIEESLDMHGMTVHEARYYVTDFIHYCCKNRLRTVLLIHGQGNRTSGKQPVLKTRLNYWLRQLDEVLAFVTATNKDGGIGALYVLLRTKTQR